MTNHLILVDASGFAHRAYHAAAKSYRSDGLPTGATVAFMAMLYGLRRRAMADNPTHGAAVFDAGRKTFRHKLFPEYKGTRDPAKRAELDAQFPFMRHAAHAMGFETIEEDGYEADDVIATLARQATEAGFRTTIVSQDKDFCQCVRDGWVEIVDPVARQRILEAQVKAKFGVPPKLVPDVQALWGDSVDNIPGIDGIGGKNAGLLIARFGGLDELLAAAAQSGQVVGTPAIRKALRKHPLDARLYRILATLVTNIKLEIDLATLQLHPVDDSHLKEMLKVLEAGHKFNALFTADPSLTLKLPHVPAPLLWWTRQAKGKEPLDKWPEEPQDGYFKRRLVRGGPWVAARIWREREKDFLTNKHTDFDILHCEVAGKRRNAAQQWEALGRWPITKADFDYLVKHSEWAKQHAPTTASANPDKKIDWNKEPLE